MKNIFKIILIGLFISTLIASDRYSYSAKEPTFIDNYFRGKGDYDSHKLYSMFKIFDWNSCNEYNFTCYDRVRKTHYQKVGKFEFHLDYRTENYGYIDTIYYNGMEIFSDHSGWLIDKPSIPKVRYKVIEAIKSYNDNAEVAYYKELNIRKKNLSNLKK